MVKYNSYYDESIAISCEHSHYVNCSILLALLLPLLLPPQCLSLDHITFTLRHGGRARYGIYILYTISCSTTTSSYAFAVSHSE